MKKERQIKRLATFLQILIILGLILFVIIVF
jgi:hypothetical protein